MQRLIEVTEAEGYWTLQAQIMTANEASRALHAKAGFREVGVRERYGHLNGVWHDVALLERQIDGGTRRRFAVEIEDGRERLDLGDFLAERRPDDQAVLHAVALEGG